MRDGRAASENELDALARLVESSADDDDLDDLCAGELPLDAQKSLTERAARDPDIANKVPAYLPLEASVREAIAARIEKEQRPNKRKVLWLAAPVALAAAAVLLWIGMREPAVDVPPYTIELTTAAPSPTRGARTDDALREGSQLEIVVRPEREIQGIHAAVFLHGSRGWRRIPIDPEVAPTGSVRVRGVIGEGPFALRGRQRIAIVVSTREIASELPREGDRSTRVYVVPLDLRP